MTNKLKKCPTMKLSYDRETDILMVETSKEPIDYAEGVASIIVHFSRKNRPVLLEILEFSDFFAKATKLAMKTKKEEMVDLGM